MKNDVYPCCVSKTLRGSGARAGLTSRLASVCQRSWSRRLASLFVPPCQTRYQIDHSPSLPCTRTDCRRGMRKTTRSTFCTRSRTALGSVSKSLVSSLPTCFASFQRCTPSTVCLLGSVSTRVLRRRRTERRADSYQGQFWGIARSGSESLSVELIGGYILYPITFLLGVPPADILPVSRLISTKIVANEVG